MTRVCITSIGTAFPTGILDQDKEARSAAERYPLNRAQKRLLPSIYRRSKVRKRFSALNQALRADDIDAFYPPARSTMDKGPSIGSRMEIYETQAVALAEQACRAALSDSTNNGCETLPHDITHVVAVSCTGLFSPGLDIQMIERLGLSSDTVRTQIGFMGCHGAFNGYKTARDIVRADSDAVVLMFCVELCTLHYHYGDDGEKIVANALFGDGAGAVIIREDAYAGMRIHDMRTRLFPDTQQYMSWKIRDHGFEMTLSPQVPDLLACHVPGWLNQWLNDHDLSINDIEQWSIHPGGPRVVETLREALDLTSADTQDSFDLLAEHGNVSSATILSIMKKQRDRMIMAPVIKQTNVVPLSAGHVESTTLTPEPTTMHVTHPNSTVRKPWVAMAFGPGLVAEGILIL